METTVLPRCTELLPRLQRAEGFHASLHSRPVRVRYDGSTASARGAMRRRPVSGSVHSTWVKRPHACPKHAAAFAAAAALSGASTQKASPLMSTGQSATS